MIDLQYTGSVFGIGALHYREAADTYGPVGLELTGTAPPVGPGPLPGGDDPFSTAEPPPKIRVRKTRDECVLELDSSLTVGGSQAEQEQRFYDDLLAALTKL